MLLVAVSGGIDSMCLAWKVRLSGEPFAIAHCNFGLRGADSDADEAFVRAWADACGVTCHVKRFETAAYANAEGISVEMAARRLRYHWFGELCREHSYSAVAVAHNANDNAETLILNLLRGTGVRGILGMKASGFLPDPEFGDIPLLRPLLGMTRADLEAFAAEQGITWREDATNAENDYKRNKIRNLVFPVFREINPRFIETLNRDMERFAEEAGGPEPVATLGRIRGRGPLRRASHGDSWEGAQSDGSEPPASSANRTAGAVNKNGQICSRDGKNGLAVNKNGVFCSRGEEFSVTEEPWDGTESVKQPEGVLILDKDKAGELVEGRWETGDWIRPLGAPGKKKMQDWFTDHHIPADEKPFVPLFKSAREPHHVLAVAGYCIDHSVRVTPSTRQILRISEKKD